jgi:hypothetical protein
MVSNSKKNDNLCKSSIVTKLTGEVVTNDVDNKIVDAEVKPKRGRKSKKELMATLNKTEFSPKEKNNTYQKQNVINFNVSEINDISNDDKQSIVYKDILNDDYVINNENIILDQTNKEITNIISSLENTGEEIKIPKKRGRKPKGGKIIQQISTNVEPNNNKQNVILHLKCFMKDLQTYSQNNSFLESYHFSICKNDLTYDLIETENNSINNNNNLSTPITKIGYDYEDYNDEETNCKDINKDINKKLKQLEYNLHVNNVNNKRSACFWDTCEFDNPPIYIPKHFINGTYHVYGCFCSPECGVAYLMKENLDSSTKFERYHLFNNIYTKIYNYTKNVKPAPDPYHMLEKFYGNFSIQEYRSLLRNERLFLIVDKPLTRILPELHEDNDEFILNNKIIPSNNYNVKTRLQNKKQNKNLILTEKFGNNQ